MIDYLKYEKERESYSRKIVASIAPKKIIVAGPGTGKTFIFEEICKELAKKGNSASITLSFINELVNDLNIALGEYSEVQTLHSFALSKFGKKHNNYFLGLDRIVTEDYLMLTGKNEDFNEVLSRLKEDDELIQFYIKRIHYYGYYSPNASIYALIKYFRKSPDKIPTYSQIFVDEYQDFNRLESELIELLSKKSPILIVGDDDQSLYGWKYAEPQGLRDKWISRQYKAFELPYCSRCPEVVVAAFNEIVVQARKKGFLNSRINKQFIYFPNVDKDEISKKHPKISIKTNVFQDAIAWHIEKEIKKHIDLKREKNKTVLIISPYVKQIDQLEKRLKQKGFRNITRRENNSQSNLMKGLMLLLEDRNSNLGWRIVAREILSSAEFNSCVKDSFEKGLSFYKFIKIGKRKIIRSLVSSLRKILDNVPVDDEEINLCVKKLKYIPKDIIVEKIKNDLNSNRATKNTHKDVMIKITTIQGAKGLDANFVFLVNFDERYILENKGTKITDEIICKFLVSITRAKDKLFIYSSDKKMPAFTSWTSEDKRE